MCITSLHVSGSCLQYERIRIHPLNSSCEFHQKVARSFQWDRFSRKCVCMFPFRSLIFVKSFGPKSLAACIQLIPRLFSFLVLSMSTTPHVSKKKKDVDDDLRIHDRAHGTVDATQKSRSFFQSTRIMWGQAHDRAPTAFDRKPVGIRRQVRPGQVGD